MQKLEDHEILSLVHTDKEKAINALFKQYYNYMCHAVYKIIADSVTVEDVVQEVYYELWRKIDKIQIQTSLKAYLRRAAINKALNHIRDQKIKFDEEEKIHELDLVSREEGQQNLELQELQDVINAAIDSLPERCRIVFSMSRFENMSYKEIAQSLDISIKTVENQISNALKILRSSVYPYVTSG